jgi:hypothetical protein
MIEVARVLLSADEVNAQQIRMLLRDGFVLLPALEFGFIGAGVVAKLRLVNMP